MTKILAVLGSRRSPWVFAALRASWLLGDRLLFVPGLGGTALVATLVASAFVGGDLPRLWRWTARPVAVVLLLVHLVLAPLLFVAYSRSLRQMGKRIVRVAESFPDDVAIGGQTAIVTHVPTVAFTGITQV